MAGIVGTQTENKKHDEFYFVVWVVAFCVGQYGMAGAFGTQAEAENSMGDFIAV